MTAANAAIGPFVAVSSASQHTCAVTTAGAPMCWGTDAYGTVAKASSMTGTFKDVEAGLWRNCGQRDDGTIACWGLYDLDTGGLVVGP